MTNIPLVKRPALRRIARLQFSLPAMFVAVAICAVIFASLQPPLVCTIATDKTVYKMGEVPKIRVAIRNRSWRTINLLGDGYLGEYGRFLPRPDCYFEMTSPKGASELDQWEPAGVAGGQHVPFPMTYSWGYSGLSPEDFVEVSPGGTFDPYGRCLGDRIPLAWIIVTEPFEVPGTYTLRFVYSTKGLTIDEDVELEDEEFRREWQEQHRKLRPLLKRVPRTTVYSNEITIQFVK